MRKSLLFIFCIIFLLGFSIFAFAADECDSNSDCFSDEKCRDNECVELDCDHDEIIRNHKCVEDYDECDYNSDCYSDERCYHGECEELDCNYNERIRNHRCETIYECYYNTDCTYDQKCMNGDCVTLFCSADSYIQNHACVKKQVQEPQQDIIMLYSPLQAHTPELIKEESFSDSLMFFLVIGVIAGIILLAFLVGVLVAR